MHVHDSENEDPVGSDLVEHTVRETDGACPPGSGSEGGPSVGKGNDPLNRTDNFSRELEAEAFALAVVIRNRVSKLGFRGLKEPDVHQPPTF